MRFYPKYCTAHNNATFRLLSRYSDGYEKFFLFLFHIPILYIPSFCLHFVDKVSECHVFLTKQKNHVTK